MKNYLLLLAIAGPLVFGSCKKDDDDDDDDVTPAQTDVISELTAGTSDPQAMQLTTENLTNSTWELTNLIQVAPNTAIYKDLYSKLPSCQKDDVYEFSKSGNGLNITDGLNYCNAGAQTKTGSWNLTNSANITISVPNLTQAGLTGDFNIVSLSESEMVLRQTVNGIMYAATYEKHMPSRAELLMNKNWRLTAEIEQNGSGTVDLFANAPACSKDDFRRYEGNGQLVLDEGQNKCNSSSPQSVSYSYYFNGYNSITSSIQGVQQQVYIQNLTATTLVLQTYYYNQGYYTNRYSTYTAF